MRHKGSGRTCGFPCHDAPLSSNTSAWLSMAVLRGHQSVAQTPPRGRLSCSTEPGQPGTSPAPHLPPWQLGAERTSPTFPAGRRRSRGTAGPALPGPRGLRSAARIPRMPRRAARARGTGPCPATAVRGSRAPVPGYPPGSPRGSAAQRWRGGEAAGPGRAGLCRAVPPPPPLPEPPPGPAPRPGLTRSGPAASCGTGGPRRSPMASGTAPRGAAEERGTAGPRPLLPGEDSAIA